MAKWLRAAFQFLIGIFHFFDASRIAMNVIFKADSSFGYTNGGIGYFPTQAAFSEGGTSRQIATSIRRPNPSTCARLPRCRGTSPELRPAGR